MELARLDSKKPSSTPDRKPRRYRLVSRLDTTGERVKRFRLSQADGLPRLERLEAVDSRSNPAA
jgi:hypothetical protein